jgi:hypothetical protein
LLNIFEITQRFRLARVAVVESEQVTVKHAQRKPDRRFSATKDQSVLGRFFSDLSTPSCSSKGWDTGIPLIEGFTANPPRFMGIPSGGDSEISKTRKTAWRWSQGSSWPRCR